MGGVCSGESSNNSNEVNANMKKEGDKTKTSNQLSKKFYSLKAINYGV